MMTNLLQSKRGLNFRPQSEFTKEHEYWEQFLWLARPKLTKKLFFELPTGVYVQSNCIGSFSGEIVPLAERENQWNSIFPGARQRLCEVYRNKAHYEAMLENGRKIVAENEGNGTERKTKSSGKSGSAGQSASLNGLQVMRFVTQPVPESTQAIKLVFKLVKGVSESELYREVPRLAVDTIKAYKMSGKIEFLTGKNSDGEFVLCAGFEPFETLPDTARVFNSRMTSRIPIAAHKGGKVKLNKTKCATEELKKLRGEYANQGKFIFVEGKLFGRSVPADSLIATALGIEKSAEAEGYLPEDEPDELYEAVNNYADNCAGAESEK